LYFFFLVFVRVVAARVQRHQH